MEALRKRERRLIAWLVAAFALAYMLVGLFRHWNFVSNAFDLGIFDQAIWHLSRFEAPASSISGYANIFGDHFHPIMLLFVPLYWIAPAPETLIIAQAVLLALSAIPVWAFLRRRLSPGLALSLTAAHGLFWGMQRTAMFDVHELAFAPVLIATAVWAVDGRRWGWMWASSLALLLVKEDMPAFGIGLGVWLVAHGERRQGLALIAASAAVLAAALLFIVPAFNPDGGWRHASAFGDVLNAPWRAPLLLVTPVEKLRTVAYWLAPFVFLSLRSPIVVLAVPIAVERLLSSTPSHWLHGSHYSAPLAPLLAMSAGDGLARFAADRRERRARRWVRGLVTASVLIAAVLPGHQPILRLFAAKHYRPASYAADAAAALAAIPLDASVVAQSPIVPHLSQRAQIFVLDEAAPNAEFVIASTDVGPWPLGSHEDVQRLVEERRALGYRTVLERGNWTVLQRR